MAPTEGPRMDEHTYAVQEILNPQEYTVKASPHDLSEKAQKLAEVGVSLRFPARLPNLQAEERRRIIMEYGLQWTNEYDHVKNHRISADAEEVWQNLAKGAFQFEREQYLPEFANLDGIYQVTNIGTHRGELKAIQPQRPWSNIGEGKRQIQEDCLVYLDPVTAETLGVSGEMNPSEIRDEAVRKTLLAIQWTRDSFHLSPKDLAWLLDQHARGKLRY